MRENLPALTSLRFFAAGAVIAHHFVPQYWPEIISNPSLASLVGEGFVGVTLFFVLSGFVLAYNYAESFRQLNAKACWSFYVARFARVYPLFLLTFLLVLFILPKGVRPTIWQILPSQLTLTQSFIPKGEYYFAANSPSWSVSTEAFFYLTFPFILALFHRGRLITSRRLITTGVVLAGGWFSYAFFLGSHSKYHWYCYVFPLSRLFDFSIGICSGLLFLRLREAKIFRVGFWAATAFEAASLAALFAMIWVSPRVGYGIRLGPYYTLVMSCIILSFAPGCGLISRLICVTPIRVMGESSYALYLLHFPVNGYFSAYKGQIGLGEASLWKCGSIVILASLAGSIFVHYYYERPMRSFVRLALTPGRVRPVDRKAPAPLKAVDTRLAS